jgi:hypothetical protein
MARLDIVFDRRCRSVTAMGGLQLHRHRLAHAGASAVMDAQIQGEVVRTPSVGGVVSLKTAPGSSEDLWSPVERHSDRDRCFDGSLHAPDLRLPG